MLTQAITSSTTLANRIVQAPAVTGAGQALVSDARNFLQTVTPALSKLQSEATGFGQGATGTVNTLLQQVSSGTPPGQLLPQLQSLGQQAGALSGEASNATSLTNASRDAFTNDSAALATEQVQLQSQANALESRRSQLEREAESLRTRLNIINGISIVFPIVKIADEIASLIQSSKLTEGQLSSVNGELSGVQQRLGQLNVLAQQTGSLKVGSAQLAGGVQSLSNVVNMINSQLQNGRQFADAADASTAKLYLAALGSNLQTLQQIAE